MTTMIKEFIAYIEVVTHSNNVHGMKIEFGNLNHPARYCDVIEKFPIEELARLTNIYSLFDVKSLRYISKEEYNEKFN